MTRIHREPFDGTPPLVALGDRVEVRDAHGQWHPATAESEPRYDYAKALGRSVSLTIAVRFAGPRDSGEPMNWPAEDVRPAPGEEATHAD